MKINYGNKLGKIIDDPKKLKKKYGSLDQKIIFALSVLYASKTLADVPNVKPTVLHKLSGNYNGCYAIRLNENYRLIFKPIKEEIDKRKVEEIIIIEITDYH